MRLIQADCRSRFTPEDFQFVQRMLADGESGGDALLRLLSDADALDRILDDPRLRERLVEPGALLNLSSAFYFYVLVRGLMLECGLDDRRLADYLAGVLAAHVDGHRKALRELRAGAGPFYLTDALDRIQRTGFPERFFLMVHLANHTLVLSAVFREWIEYRRRRRAAPDPDFFSSVSRSQFRRSRDHALSREYDLHEVFDAVDLEFDRVQDALRRLSREYLFPRHTRN